MSAKIKMDENFKKFWEWMQEKDYGCKDSTVIITTKSEEYYLDMNEKSIGCLPNKQILIGYKIEYLIEKIGSLTLKYYHDFDEFKNHLDELIEKLEKSNG